MGVEFYRPTLDPYVRLQADSADPTEFFVSATPARKRCGAGEIVPDRWTLGWPGHDRAFSQSSAQIRQFAKALLAMVGDD